jgi:FtsZ-interacting cell division protein ZipA
MMQTMNPLFLGLLIAGVVLVIGVVLINWLQERRVRRRIDAAFRKPGSTASDADRVEPMYNSNEDAVDAYGTVDTAEADADGGADAAAEPGDMQAAMETVRAAPSRVERSAIAPDPDIECVVMLRPAQSVPTAALAGALSMPASRPVRWLGRRGPGLPWQVLDMTMSGPWQEIAACMLIANRSGAATRADAETFLRSAEQVAAGLPAACELPDAVAEAARAEALDRFCADLDVQIGLTILKSDEGQILGTRLRGVAEAAGFRLTPAGQFDYMQDETGATLYALQNYKQEPFTVEGLRMLTTPGIVLLLDVPRVPDPVRVFDQMRMVAKRMTQSLEGVLVDDNRRPLNDASLAAIRAQVQATATALSEAHIDPGGPRAVRLFD